MANILTRTLLGNHAARNMMTPGNSPASVTPSRNRRMMKDVSPCTNAKQAETMPHVMAMRASHTLAPNLVRSRLLGISNRA